MHQEKGAYSDLQHKPRQTASNSVISPKHCPMRTLHNFFPERENIPEQRPETLQSPMVLSSSESTHGADEEPVVLHKRQLLQKDHACH